jgi:MIP family channel proteins
MSHSSVADTAERPAAAASPSGTSPRPAPLWVPLLAESIGTFGLVFAGCGAIMINTLSNGQITHVGVSLVFGLVIAAMIYAAGHLSGAHLNPAVTLGFVLARHFPLRRLVGYWLAQLLGAVAASACLRLLLGDVARVGATLPAGTGGAWQAFGFEVLLTFFLMFVIMALATDTRAVGQAAALAIGATVGLEALFAGPISGASMNPARSLAPALISGTWTAQWVYVLAPLLGAAGGAIVYRWLRVGSQPSTSSARQHADVSLQTTREETHA